MITNKLKQQEKFCIVCGRRIPELSARKKTCSDFCRRRYKCGYAPYKDFKSAPYKGLSDLQKEAQAAGISYGKYMAMKHEDKK